eukprot:COSAG01_NODE_32292_length_583_cov_1.679752_1_plen_87_part_10
MSAKGAYGLTRLGDWVDWVDFQSDRRSTSGDAANQQSQVGVMGPGRGRSRPPWRDASGAGDLWRLCQAVYMATIPTWLGGVGGAAIP